MTNLWFKRKFVKLDNIDVWDKCHTKKDDGTFDVWVEKDGKSLEEHLEGIKYFKKQLLEGNKILPPLVLEKEDGKYDKLDGFKRIMAYKELGVWDTIEVFVCNKRSKENRVMCAGKEMVCKSGGQSHKRFKKSLEGDEGKPPKETILSRGKDIRLELRENIHLHWGKKGKSRVVMGKRDFELLANAIINGKSN